MRTRLRGKLFDSDNDDDIDREKVNVKDSRSRCLLDSKMFNFSIFEWVR